MHYLRTVLFFFGLIGLSQIISAEDHSSQTPAPIPVEFWICEYNEGKSASDLEPGAVAARAAERNIVGVADDAFRHRAWHGAGARCR